MASYSVKECFDDLLVDFDPNDQHIVTKIQRFRTSYMTANRDHMEFFGGNLLGVNIVRFKDSDVKNFLEIFDIDYETLKTSVRQINTIDHRHKVASDALNLFIFYLIHRYQEGNKNGNSDYHYQARYNLAMIFFCRCAAALLSANFWYTADPKEAQLAYANLSQKYLIKQLGSWNKFLDYRARALLDPKTSPHVRTLKMFDLDDKITYAIADSQGRVRDTFRSYYSELMIVHDSGQSLSSQSGMVKDAEGEMALREKTTGPETYVFYMREILGDRDTFVRDNLLRIVIKNNSNTSIRAVTESVEWLSLAFNDPKQTKLVDDFVSRVLVQMAYFLQYNIEPSRHRDMNYVLANLKNLFLSTRSNDPDLFKVRSIGETILTKALGPLSPSLMMATRTAVIMYICLRAMVGKNSR